MPNIVEKDYPVWGLMPKNETGVTSFLAKYPEYDGRNITIAIFDSGVDPGAPGLQKTSDGKVKVIERFDCSGCGDVVTTTIVQPKEGYITGLSGRKLKIPDKWENPSNNYRLGVKHAFDLYPERLRERIQEEDKEQNWDNQYKTALAEASRQLAKFEAKFTSTVNLSENNKLEKEDLEAKIEILTAADKKYTNVGSVLDCILFHDGTKWMACVDTTEQGDLEKCPLLGEYSITQDFAPLTTADQLNFSINVHDDGNILELVGLCSSHGTHVASISAAYFPNEPQLCGIAPGAQIVSLTIGDGRLGSMETGTALVRAMIKVMELQKIHPVHVINMSYGEHTHWSNSGRIGELMNEVVNKYGIIWVASAGNHGPALSTVGTPPDISQETVVGVAAYVSPDMMVAEYSMRQKLPGMPFTWSSRGPTIDGGFGVTVCAPGGAITSVPNFTLRNSQLMNGTSMASPHVAGAVAILVSGLKHRDVPFSPYSIKRALENSATYLPEIECFAQGHGLLQVDKTFDYLVNYHQVQERDVRFHIMCGPNCTKGVYIRNKLRLSSHEWSVSVEPYFKQQTVASTKIAFNMRLTLVCDASYVSHPAHLDLSNMVRAFGIKVNTSVLTYGVHRTSIDAYDVTCVLKGPVFRIPITIIQPQEVTAPSYLVSFNNMTFRPNVIKRQFFIVPELATWAVLRIRSPDSDAVGRFVIHTMQIQPKQSCKSLEMNKNTTVSANSECVHNFPVRGGLILEVVIAKYWANLGEMNINYSISFHGIKPNQPNITMQAADGIYSLEVTSLQGEEILPSVSLKNSVQILKPAESKLVPLTVRDVIPPGRQIYELLLTYNFHLNKATEVCPNSPLLSDVLYESEFESQLWMLYDVNKQYLGCGDAYPSKYSTKLDKGDYVIKMHIRHDKKEYLEKLSDTPLLLNQKLTNAITLDVYNTHSQAVIGGKKAAVGHSLHSSTIPLYIAPLSTDKFVPKSNNAAHYLTGYMTYAKDELGKKADNYQIKYILYDYNKKIVKVTDKDKSKLDEYKDALRDLKLQWLTKFDAGISTDEFCESLVKEYPDFLLVYTSYLQCIDPLEPKKQLPMFKTQNLSTSLKEDLQKYIAVCENILNKVDQDKLLAFVGVKIDQRPEAVQIKQQMERQKTAFLEALCRKGLYLCRLYELSLNKTEETEERVPSIEDISGLWKSLLKFADPTDAKVTTSSIIYFALWHATVNKHYGRVLKFLGKLQEDKLNKDIEERYIEVCELLGWTHIVSSLKKSILSKFPTNYKPF